MHPISVSLLRRKALNCQGPCVVRRLSWKPWNNLMLTNSSKSLLAQARINTFIFFYGYLQEPKAIRQFKKCLSQKWKKHCLTSLISIYLSDKLYLSIYHFLASLKMWAQEGLRFLSLLFLFLSASRVLLEVPLKFCLQISPLPWNDAIPHFIQEVALVMCLPNPWW